MDSTARHRSIQRACADLGLPVPARPRQPCDRPGAGGRHAPSVPRPVADRTLPGHGQRLPHPLSGGDQGHRAVRWRGRGAGAARAQRAAGGGRRSTASAWTARWPPRAWASAAITRTVDECRSSRIRRCWTTSPSFGRRQAPHADGGRHHPRFADGAKRRHLGRWRQLRRAPVEALRDLRRWRVLIRLPNSTHG